MSTIGENIQAARESRNMSRQELARKACIGVKSIEKYETGEKVPEVQTIMKISTVLDIPASELAYTAGKTFSSDIDSEIQLLINKIGKKKAKQILLMAKEHTGEDFPGLKEIMD